MKSLINIDYSVLKDYEEFDRVNVNWDIASYLNVFYDVNDAIAFSKFFFPDFVKVKGCILLKIRYDRRIFNQWFKELNGNVSLVEEMCNLYELKDIFHINKVSTDLDFERKTLSLLGHILKKSLELNLMVLYPESKFKVKVFNEYDSEYITFYSCK